MEQLRDRIAVVPQKAVLFKGTIAENLRWGNKEATDEELLEAAKAAQADDVLGAKGGLSGMVAQGGKNLSGGQRQRLTIARALVKKAPVLILDDSASALDMATDARLRKAIKALPYQPTVFIVSQRTNAIMDADKIVVLDDGSVAGIGSHEQLLASCEVYREIYESQFKKEAQA
jgi:ABC-type multidrug transport system fused ATPase/permease subunit